jgi:chromosome segregation ATPase
MPNPNNLHTPSALDVAQARAVIVAAEQADAAASKVKMLEQLRTVRAELRTARPQLEALRRRIMYLQADGENLARAARVREERISELMAARPAVCDYLPADPECVQWSAVLEQKQSEIAQLREAGAALPNLYQLQLSGVELAMRISDWQFAETNILNRLRGMSGKAWAGHLIEGGISTAF